MQAIIAHDLDDDILPAGAAFKHHIRGPNEQHDAGWRRTRQHAAQCARLRFDHGTERHSRDLRGVVVRQRRLRPVRLAPQPGTCSRNRSRPPRYASIPLHRLNLNQVPAGPRDIDDSTQLLRLDNPRLVLLGSIRLHQALLADDSLVGSLDDVPIRDGCLPHRLGLRTHYLPGLGRGWRRARPQPLLRPQLRSPGDLHSVLRLGLLQGLPPATFLEGVVRLEWGEGVPAPWSARNHDAVR